jgi:hypothetical protein
MAEHIEVPTKYADGIEVKNGSELKQLHSGDMYAAFDEMNVFETDSTASVEFWLGGELVCSYFIKPHLARRFEVEWSRISDYVSE